MNLYLLMQMNDLVGVYVMAKKLMMNSYSENSNMQMQKGVVTADKINATITVNNLLFEPDIVIIRIISDISSTHSLLWTYTPYGSSGIRTDSSGINSGVQLAGLYNDNGYVKGYACITVNENSFTFNSVSVYGQIQQGDEFEWIAIKYE